MVLETGTGINQGSLFDNLVAGRDYHAAFGNVQFHRFLPPDRFMPVRQEVGYKVSNGQDSYYFGVLHNLIAYESGAAIPFQMEFGFPEIIFKPFDI